MNGPGAGNGGTRLLLVVRRRAARRSLKTRLAREEDLEVVGEAGDAEGAIPLAAALRPDVILLAVEAPGMGGLEAAGALRGSTPRSAVVTFAPRDDTTRGRSAGEGVAPMAEHRSEETLVAAIRGVAAERRRRTTRGASTDIEATAYGASPLLISVLTLPVLTVAMLVEATLAWKRD